MRSLLASTTYHVPFATSQTPDATPTATVYADETSLGAATVTSATGTNAYSVAVSLPANVTTGQVITVAIEWAVGGETQSTARLLVGQVGLLADVASAVADEIGGAVVPTIIAEQIVKGGTNIRYRGTQWTFTIDDIGDEPSKLYFTAKRRDGADSEATLQVVKTAADDPSDGLVRLNGAAVDDASLASIAVSTYTEDAETKRRAVVTISAEATKQIAPKDGYKFDFYSVDGPEVLGSGRLQVLAAVTRATE